MKNDRSIKVENIHRNGFTGTLNVPDSLPDPHVLAKPARRKLTLEYELRIMQEAEVQGIRLSLVKASFCTFEIKDFINTIISFASFSKVKFGSAVFPSQD